MRYEALIRQAVPTFEGTFTLAELLSRVDALDKSVPTLAELNAAFAELKRNGDVPSFDWSPVTPEAYSEAVAHNHEAMVQRLESQGISREQQDQTLRWHASLWPKRDA
jgi:hypothetical protein